MPTVRVPASVAVLSALDNNITEIGGIAKWAKMSRSAVTQTLARLKKKEPPQVRRTNKHGFGVVAKYKITRSGRAVLQRALKKMEGGK